MIPSSLARFALVAALLAAGCTSRQAISGQLAQQLYQSAQHHRQQAADPQQPSPELRSRNRAFPKSRTDAIPRPPEAASKTPAPAQQNPNGKPAGPSDTASREPTLYLSLQQCIQRALRHNLKIRTSGYEPGISLADIVRAEAAFDATFFLETNYTYLDTPVSTLLATGEPTKAVITKEAIFRGGVRKPLATGASVEVYQKTDHFQSSSTFFDPNPYYDLDLVVSLRQPLLRGFGIDVNRSQIYIARNNHRIALARFRQQVMETLLQVEQAYWELSFAREQYKIQQWLLAQTRKTLEKIAARMIHDADRVKYTQALAALKNRETLLISAENQIRLAEYNLKSLLNDPEIPVDGPHRLVATDRPTRERLQVDRQQAIETAKKHRPELKQARLALANSEIQVAVARNQLLPRLDIELSQTVNGLGSTLDRAIDSESTGDMIDWYAGLTLEIPIGNRAASAQLRQQKLSYLQALAKLMDTTQAIVTDVNRAITQLRSYYRQITANHEAAEAASENLDALEKREQLGQALTPEFLELKLNAQVRLANAKIAELRSIVDYNIAIIDLQRAQGSLLGYDNVVIAEHGETPSLGKSN